MGVWDTSTPVGTDLLRTVDDKIREMKSALQDALRCDDTEGVESVFPGSAPSTAPVFRYRGLKDVTASRPAAGQYGLFFDTTRNVLQRDNGVSWDDVATVIPAGTKMVFYQASAPTGWTKDTANNDKALRVVSGSGGGTGGTNAVSSGLAHTHTTGDFTLTIAEMPAHTHTVSDQTAAGASYGTNATAGNVDTKTTSSVGGGAAHNHGATGSTSPTFQYIDVIVCTKD